jgi:hypothetical protein
MDKSFHPQESDTGGRLSPFFTALLRIFDTARHWLAGFIQLTEEEQREAGIYLDRPYEE